MSNSEWGALCCVYGFEDSCGGAVKTSCGNWLHITRGDVFPEVVVLLPRLVRTSVDAMLSMAESCKVCGHCEKK